MNDTELRRFISGAGLVLRKDMDASERCMRNQSCSLADALVSTGALGEDDVRRIEAYARGVPFVSLSGRSFSREVLMQIPEPVARRHNAVAYGVTERGLEVAFLNLDGRRAVAAALRHSGHNVLPRLTDTASMKHALTSYQRTLKTLFGERLRKESTALAGMLGTRQMVGAFHEIATHDAVVRLVDTLFRHAYAQGVRDIHIEPRGTEALVRYRIGGMLYDAMALPGIAGAAIVARMKLLGHCTLDEHPLPSSGRFRVSIDGTSFTAQVSALLVCDGEQVTVRLAPATHRGFTLEGLGFHGTCTDTVHEGAHTPGGMVLVSGPPSSGCTTTLYTLLDMLNLPSRNIATIEDTVEYQLPHVNQVRAAPDVGFTIAAGVRALLRHDPDVLMVGTIDNAEAARMAIDAVSEGRTVLAALSAPSAGNALSRLLGFGVSPEVLAATVRLVIGQRLVRRLAGRGEAYTLTLQDRTHLSRFVDLERVLSMLKEEGVVRPSATWSTISFYRDAGRPEGTDTPAPLIGLQEVLPLSPSVVMAVREGREAHEIETLAKNAGMRALAEDALYKAVLGQVALEEITAMFAAAAPASLPTVRDTLSA